MGIFERYLSLWVALAMGGGVLLGLWQPGWFAAVASFSLARINLPVALLIWLMIYPMMIQIDFTAMQLRREHRQGLMLTLTINWLIKPFSLWALGSVFFFWLYKSLISPEQAADYLAGLILLGVAPCTAMVFVWSQLTRGDANYTLMQVGTNDIIMLFAYAPIAGFLMGLSNIHIPWDTLILSLVLYVLLPLLAGIATRRLLGSSEKINNFCHSLKPLSVTALIGTVLLLFALQANAIAQQPLIIALIAIPLTLQTYGIFGLCWLGARLLRLPLSISAPACLIGTSNFFELAVAVAIGLFGLDSGAALATVVGVLVEVPIMLSLVYYLNRQGQKA
ncbi:MAG TPA: ACR3 family arsenite efflux transporter [Cellvibrionaceae bacterium]|nr:ACR3 family arsenite efflux transporter [Cellvibrionaceae bacterium]HNG59988.1 ACR3 family arsenite efflux transporter [Cellvibrionaceae bacterium]